MEELVRVWGVSEVFTSSVNEGSDQEDSTYLQQERYLL